MDGAPSGQAEQFPLTSGRKSSASGSNRGPLHYKSTALLTLSGTAVSDHYDLHVAFEWQVRFSTRKLKSKLHVKCWTRRSESYLQ
eukprot:2130241-Prymnesium_polylepis.1